MSSASPTALRVVILGNDAFLAARPAQPLQLARACQQAGYDLVAPVTWGEELLATRVAERASQVAERATLVVAHCPKVSDALRSAPPAHASCVTSVSPPRATARYVRAALQGRSMRVVYVGGCPEAVVRILYRPLVKSRGLGSRVAAPGPSPFPSAPWQRAHFFSYTAFPLAASPACCAAACAGLHQPLRHRSPWSSALGRGGARDACVSQRLG